MKERPIQMKPEMVLAILENRKTETRRVVKPQPDAFDPACWTFGEGHSGKGWYCSTEEYPEEGSEFYSCPYGVVGDRLWIKEPWQYANWTEDGVPWIQYKADEKSLLRYHPERAVEAVVWEKLSRPENIAVDGIARDRKWRSSLYMRRWASCLTLEITEIKVERVQDISEEACLAEGMRGNAGGPWGREGLLEDFEGLWDSIHSKDGFHWDANPWVWVIQFKGMRHA